MLRLVGGPWPGHARFFPEVELCRSPHARTPAAAGRHDTSGYTSIARHSSGARLLGELEVRATRAAVDEPEGELATRAGC
jgi:hypothetical protein